MNIVNSLLTFEWIVTLSEKWKIFTTLFWITFQFSKYIHQKRIFLYYALAALYSNNIDRRTFHNPNAYKKYRKLLNLTNIPFPMKNKHIFHFLKNNPRLNISIRLFDSVTISSREMKIFNYKTIGKGKNLINILFHKVYKNKKSMYHHYWLNF